ncbi:hypothetical protein IHE45_15G066700 [Dioscorea alata]|uniref:Uncharacterized protein n=1 Tax=Dioscorea alata TaxID=55571 RepID=A0ACB7ULT6_DIOAL|nr:hypothetical protein IHE45_15G066700 [Dioscorea alata]
MALLYMRRLFIMLHGVSSCFFVKSNLVNCSKTSMSLPVVSPRDHCFILSCIRLCFLYYDHLARISE